MFQIQPNWWSGYPQILELIDKWSPEIFSSWIPLISSMGSEYSSSQYSGASFPSRSSRSSLRAKRASEREMNIEYWISKQQKSNYAPHVRATLSDRDSKVVALKKLHEESALQFDLGRKNPLRACWPAWGQIGGHFPHATFWALPLWNHGRRA